MGEEEARDVGEAEAEGVEKRGGPLLQARWRGGAIGRGAAKVSWLPLRLHDENLAISHPLCCTALNRRQQAAEVIKTHYRCCCGTPPPTQRSNAAMQCREGGRRGGRRHRRVTATRKAAAMVRTLSTAETSAPPLMTRARAPCKFAQATARWSGLFWNICERTGARACKLILLLLRQQGA